MYKPGDLLAWRSNISNGEIGYLIVVLYISSDNRTMHGFTLKPAKGAPITLYQCKAKWEKLC